MFLVQNQNLYFNFLVERLSCTVQYVVKTGCHVFKSLPHYKLSNYHHMVKDNNITLIRSMLHNLFFHIIINYCHRFYFIFLLLVAIFMIIIILELLCIFVLMPAEPIPNNLLSCFKAQKFGILYQTQ